MHLTNAVGGQKEEIFHAELHGRQGGLALPLSDVGPTATPLVSIKAGS